MSDIRNMQIRWLNYSWLSHIITSSSSLHWKCTSSWTSARYQQTSGYCKKSHAQPSTEGMTIMGGLLQPPRWARSPRCLGPPLSREGQTVPLLQSSSSAVLVADFPKAAICSSGSHPEVQSLKRLIYSSDQRYWCHLGVLKTHCHWGKVRIETQLITFHCLVLWQTAKI